MAVAMSEEVVRISQERGKEQRSSVPDGVSQTENLFHFVEIKITRKKVSKFSFNILDKN